MEVEITVYKRVSNRLTGWQCTEPTLECVVFVSQGRLLCREIVWKEGTRQRVR